MLIALQAESTNTEQRRDREMGKREADAGGSSSRSSSPQKADEVEDEKNKVAFSLLGPTFRSRYSRSFFSCM